MKIENFNWQFISAINLILIIYLSFFIVPGSPDIPGFIPHVDKIGHFTLYGFQAISLSMYLRKYIFKNLNTIIFIICFIIGLSIECLQPVLTNNRIFDYFDILANLTGVLISLIMMNRLIRNSSKY
tara:strand:- start:1240 stop:1617 length:378 start_codon:yes stop_codon:yes gene_type:complete